MFNWIYNLFFKRRDEQMVREFIEKFPNKCMICSMHFYGVNNGFGSAMANQPEPHTCIENYSRWI